MGNLEVACLRVANHLHETHVGLGQLPLLELFFVGEGALEGDVAGRVALNEHPRVRHVLLLDAVPILALVVEEAMTIAGPSYSFHQNPTRMIG